MDSIEEAETEWLIPYWVPKGGITLLVGDGGIGKTNPLMITGARQVGKSYIIEKYAKEHYAHFIKLDFYTKE